MFGQNRRREGERKRKEFLVSFCCNSFFLSFYVFVCRLKEKKKRKKEKKRKREKRKERREKEKRDYFVIIFILVCVLSIKLQEIFETLIIKYPKDFKRDPEQLHQLEKLKTRFISGFLSSKFFAFYSF